MARILLVDDDQGGLATMRQALERDGHAVTAFAESSAALAVVSGGGTYDLLISDLQMAGVDGLALAARVRQRQPAIPVLLVSAHADALDEAVRSRITAMRVLAKPFQIDRLRAEVREMLAGAGPSAR